MTTGENDESSHSLSNILPITDDTNHQTNITPSPLILLPHMNQNLIFTSPPPNAQHFTPKNFILSQLQTIQSSDIHQLTISTTPVNNHPIHDTTSIVPMKIISEHADEKSLTPNEISVGKIFATKDDLTLCINIFHLQIGRVFRQFRNYHISIHFICSEKSKFIIKEKQPLEDISHLCNASYWGRRRYDNNNQDTWILTECIPHTCNPTSNVSTPGS